VLNCVCTDFRQRRSAITIIHLVAVGDMIGVASSMIETKHQNFAQFANSMGKCVCVCVCVCDVVIGNKVMPSFVFSTSKKCWYGKDCYFRHVKSETNKQVILIDVRCLFIETDVFIFINAVVEYDSLCV